MSAGTSGLSAPIIAAAAEVARSISARAVLAYFDSLDKPRVLKKAVGDGCDVILVCRAQGDVRRARRMSPHVLAVPAFDLSRMDQVKVALLAALSRRLLEDGDALVFLVGVAGHGVDTLVAMRVGEEFELFQSVGHPGLDEHIRGPVFERVLTICLELGNEGREGKAVGALFVIGDHAEVHKHSQIARINPFRGYAERKRNILDESIRDTVKELAKLDGAFVIQGNGAIVSAGTTLHAAPPGGQVIPGFGARQAAAAAITACTESIAISLSESTGTVRVWRRGGLIAEIEKSPRGRENASAKGVKGAKVRT